MPWKNYAIQGNYKYFSAYLFYVSDLLLNMEA